MYALQLCSAARQKALIVTKSYERKRKIALPTIGPNVIAKIDKNGTVFIEHKHYHETINIR